MIGPLFTEDEVRNDLQWRCAEAGGSAAWARARGLTPGYVREVLIGTRKIGPEVMAALGYERVIGYRAKEALT